MEKYFKWTTWENLIGWEKFIDAHRNPRGLQLRAIALAIFFIGLWMQILWLPLVAAGIYLLGGFFPKPYRPTPWVEKFIGSGFLRLENMLCQVIAFSIYSSGFFIHRKKWILLGFFIAGLGFFFFRKSDSAEALPAGRQGSSDKD